MRYRDSLLEYNGDQNSSANLSSTIDVNTSLISAAIPNAIDDQAPIGVYDSGVGGLSVLQALRAQLPAESFIYVADSGNAPYGDRSEAFIQARAIAVGEFFARQNAKALVIACNTASVMAAQRLREQYSMPIVALEPAIKPAAQTTKSKVVLVLATTNTINSRSVATLCRSYATDINIILQPCPGLADQVERGELQTQITNQLLEIYLQPGLAAGADTIVLGCTHYAFLHQQISAIAGPAVQIMEPSAAIARQVARVIAPSPMPVAAPTRFYSSGDPGLMSSFLRVVGEPFQPIFALPVL